MLKSFLLLVFLSIPLLLNAQNFENKADEKEYWEEFNVQFPIALHPEVDASKYKGVFEDLKRPNESNLVLSKVFDQSLIVAIYEKSINGDWTRKDILRFPSHDDEGSAKVIGFLDSGIKALRVIHDGNVGSNEYQKVLTLVAWNGSKFVAVFMETLSYISAGPSWETNYKTTISYNQFGSKTPSIKVSVKNRVHEESYENDKGEELNKSKDVKEEWSEDFDWNKDNFSFYDRRKEELKIKTSKYKDEIRFEKMRLNFLNKRPDVYHLDYPDLDELGIML